MNYHSFFVKALAQYGYDVIHEPNAFLTPRSDELGWPLRYPNVNWGTNTVLVLTFQDRVTYDKHGQVIELQNLEKHYGDRASRVLVVHMHPNLQTVYHGPIKLVEFSSHNYREIYRFKLCLPQWHQILDRPKTQAWQSLNGRMSDHRSRVANILKHWPNGILSLGHTLPLDQWPYATYPGTENDENFIRLADIYGSCAVNVVTESSYDQNPGLFSEKTLQAMLAQQIPIVIGSRGIVASLKQHNFDMFDDLVDISYDDMPDNTRVEHALWWNQDLILGKIDLANFQPRLIAQREFLLEQYCNLMEQNFTAQISKLNFE